MDAQQLATKVAQLESRVATLEDEGKIVKGEVKQILTEIRSAILVRDNPFEGDGGGRFGASVSDVAVPSEPAAKVEVVAPSAAAEPPRREPPPEAEAAREPTPIRPTATTPAPAPQPPQPQWTLLTIAGLSAWAEDAVRRVGSLRLEILLDMCEASGHLSGEAREALSRVTELDLPEPESAPSTNDTVAILRQLDALVNDMEDRASSSIQRRAA